MNAQPRADVYISADVETDGPIPGPYSMLSFGLAVVGVYDGQRFELHDPRARTFYIELRPISETFDPEALAVNRLDRDRLAREGAGPAEAMADAAAWVQQAAGDRRPILVAYPVAFDWSFLYWYFERFAPEGSPFGYSSCLDIRTLYLAVAGTVFDRSGKGSMPDWLLPRSPHTHNALDDAIEQGELFSNLLGWVVNQRARLKADGELEMGERSDEGHVPSWLVSHLLPNP